MTFADVFWILAAIVGIFGFLGMVDEVFPAVRPWIIRRALLRWRLWRDRAPRHPIIKDWK